MWIGAGCPGSTGAPSVGAPADGTTGQENPSTSTSDDDDDRGEASTAAADETGDSSAGAPATGESGDEEESTGGSSGSGGSTGAFVCPDATSRCVLPVEGWEGPIAVRSAPWPAERLACEGAYADVAFAGAMDFDAGAHQCTCACTPPEEVVCSGTVTLVVYDDAACSEPTSTEALSGTACVDVDNTSLTGAYVSLHNNLSSGGTDRCTPDLAAEIGPVTFAEALLGCDGAEVGDSGCEEGELCVPRPEAPFESALCIWREGDALCPIGSAFSSRRLTYGDFEDDRACGDCGCGFPLGDCLGAEVNLFSSSDCDGLVMIADDDCNPGPAGGVLLSGAQVATPGTYSDDVACPVVADEELETGSAAPIEPVTVCCLED